ncbi:MAG: hypothetical protein V4494_00490 [Chlamydiota bacterium]
MAQIQVDGQTASHTSFYPRNAGNQQSLQKQPRSYKDTISSMSSDYNHTGTKFGLGCCCIGAICACIGQWFTAATCCIGGFLSCLCSNGKK